MAILRKSNKERYTTILQSITMDKRLSLKDLGLLVKLLSLPDNWNFSEKGLAKILEQDGQTSIRTAIKNLEEYGYLTRKRERDETGKIIGVEWIITEEPTTIKEVENPRLENHNLDNPNLETHPQYNTKEYNTKKYNTNSLSEKENEKQTKKENKKFTPPTVDEVKAYCDERNNHVDPEKFVTYYDSVGWYVGKKKMKNWKSSVILWEKGNISEQSTTISTPSSYDISAYENYSIFDDQ